MHMKSIAQSKSGKIKENKDEEGKKIETLSKVTYYNHIKTFYIHLPLSAVDSLAPCHICINRRHQLHEAYRLACNHQQTGTSFSWAFPFVNRLQFPKQECSGLLKFYHMPRVQNILNGV